MDYSPPPEDSSMLGTQFRNIPLTLSQDITSLDTQPQRIPLPQKPRRVSRNTRRPLAIVLLLSISLLIIVSVTVIVPVLKTRSVVPIPTLTPRAVATSTPTPTPTPIFDPGQGAVLPTHRVVAFYAVPFAEPTGPGYEPTDTMLAALRQQGAAYEQLDPKHPVQLGIDLVVSVPDGFPGPQNSYSHHVDAGTIQSYIDFCSKNDLLLFLDLNFGLSPIMDEVKFFLPYLEKYAFVHMAIDPEWMFPRRNGIPGVNLSNVRASDLNPIIESIAEIPMQFHVPRKILIIHQYRPDGDGLKDPSDPGQAEIADKRNLLFDPRVDVVIHVDSVGGYSGDIQDKRFQYSEWVQQDMKKYSNFLYGGFKLFYQHEAKIRLMTPKEVLSLDPPPMVVTYGN
ncbi:MAG: hypothetical protein E6J22_20275 [Chloroflexi bacterium]|nr:MAG: hypothetical protein E6J22_20275 [Chloroflexota bacterium]